MSEQVHRCSAHDKKWSTGSKSPSQQTWKTQEISTKRFATRAGLVLIVVGFLVAYGTPVGRILGVVAGISAIVNFASLPYCPLWSVFVIALNVFLIWALVTYGAVPEIV